MGNWKYEVASCCGALLIKDQKLKGYGDDHFSL